ncbi:MAG: hypothetical protein Q8J69_04895 [Sphingobacteriaceae bacterium]|nr:hypothetical protein [Sphingobacteriaceae bacterium]
MKTLWFMLFLMAASSASHAQITQEGRMELESKEGGIGSTAALGERGVLVFGNSEKASDGIWEVTRYDTKFEMVSKSAVKHNKRTSFLTHLFTNDGKEVLFVFANASLVEVVRYNIESSNTTEFQSKLRFKPINAYLLNNTLFLEGVVKSKPVVMQLNLLTGNSKMVMVPGPGKNTIIKDIAIDHEQQIVAISVRYGSKKDMRKWKFEIGMFDENGSRISDPIIIENDPDRYTLDADITWLGKDEYLLSGNYSSDTRPLSNGIFMAAFKNGRQQFIRYHNFADMNNFFQYLSAKNKSKVEKKVAKKKEKGKDNAIQVHMTTHKISEFAGQYVILGEAYFPTYRTVVTTTYVNGSPQTTTYQVFDGYQYTHATILGLDKQGNKLWDHCFEIDIPKKPFYVRQNIRGLMTEKEIRLFYPSGANLKSMIIAKDNSLIEKNLGKLQTQRVGDKIKREDLPDVKYWYGDYFLLSGSQQIKNTQDKSKGKNRNVYYLAKIKVDAEFDPNALDNDSGEDVWEEDGD